MMQQGEAMSSTERRQAFRRTRRVAVGVGCIGLLTFVVTDPGSATSGAPVQEETFNNGTGTAFAFGYKANPTNGNLSFGVTVGESVAGHQNTAASAESRAVNPGVIGLTLAGEGCDGGDPALASEDQPQPVIARSGEDGAAEGFTASEQGVVQQFARATTAPFAEAITTIAPSGDPATIFVDGGRTISRSGVMGGNLREAFARTEINGVSLAGGVIKIQGMSWQAIHRSGAINETLGSFTLDGLLIADQQVPLPGDGVQQLKALGDALRPLGFEVTPPTVRVEQNIVFVDPLVIAIIPSPQRDAVTGGILAGAQPVRDAVTKALLEADCSNASLITVGDIGIGGLTGAGSLGVELGGVQATTSEIQRFEFALPPALPALAPTLGAGSPGIAGTAGTTSNRPTTAPATTQPEATGGAGTAAPDEQIAAAPIAGFAGERGGIMALIGGGGLLLMLGTAEGDRRKMRSAQRALPMEA